MNRNAATHRGECQICGSTQMLPGNVLSKHGYTRKWGFFSGVCHGAGRLPFELSKNDIAAAVANVEKVIAQVEAEIQALEDLNSDANGLPVAWHHTYLHSGFYQWERIPVINFKANQYDTFVSYSAEVQTGAKKRDGSPVLPSRIEAYSDSFKLSSVRHWVHFLNCKYAKALRSQNSSRRDWVRWQAERCAKWAIKPLKARESI